MTSQQEPATPEDREVVRLYGLAGALLELWSRRDEPGHEDRATELQARTTAGDMIAALLYAAEFFGHKALGPDAYRAGLTAWQLSAAVLDAITPPRES